LPETHCAVVFSAAGLRDLKHDQQAMVERVVRVGTSGRVRVLGDGLFTYALQGLPDAPHCSVWLFLVYARVAFIGFTARRQDVS
jgi:hypothetical protein